MGSSVVMVRVVSLLSWLGEALFKMQSTGLRAARVCNCLGDASVQAGMPVSISLFSTHEGSMTGNCRYRALGVATTASERKSKAEEKQMQRASKMQLKTQLNANVTRNLPRNVPY